METLLALIFLMATLYGVIFFASGYFAVGIILLAIGFFSCLYAVDIYMETD